MSTKHLFLTLLAAISLAWGCQRPEAGLSFPTIDLSLTDASVAEPASTFTVHVRSNRAWRATPDVDWIAIDPDSGPGSVNEQPVTITVQNNTGFDRTGHVVFDIIYDTFTLPVTQAGLGKPEDFLIYYNDFDLEAATQTFGSGGKSWPYLDQFGGWKNEKGIGVSGIEYKVGGISCRTNSASNGNYSDYEGSGVNNLLFGSSNYFVVKDMDLKGLTDFRLSFGSEKYDNNNQDSNFTTTEFFVYLSDNGTRWVPLTYEFKGTAAGRWNVAEGLFSVPKGTEKLSLYVMTTVSSVYRMDDLKIEAVTTAGTLLDFSLGIEMNPGGGDTPGGGGDTPTDAQAVTVAQFLAAAESETQVYELVGTIGGSINTSYGNFDLTDDTGTIYVYGMTATYLGYGKQNDQSYASLGLNAGDKIKVRGYRGSFTNPNTGAKKDEMLYPWFVEKISGGGGGDTPAGDVPFDKLNPSNFVEGDYVIAGTSSSIMKAARQSNYYVAASDFDLTQGKAPSDEHIWHVAKSGSGYTIKNKAGSYLGIEVSGTYYNLRPDLASAFIWTLTANADGSIAATGSETGAYTISYDATHKDFTVYNKTPNCPFFYRVDGAPSGGGGGDTPGGMGSGTQADPYTPAGARNAVKDLTWTSTTVYDATGEVYVKGKISRIPSGGTFTEGGTFGNASFYISEDGTETEEFYCFRILYLNNRQFADGDTDIKVGDEVVICGKLMNYRGNTPETVAGEAYLYALNPSGGGGDTPGGGGDTPSGDSIHWVTNSENQTWTTTTDATYGAGYTATSGGMTVSFFKATSTSNPLAPNANHIRVYKNSHLSISVAGKRITGVLIKCAPPAGTSQYCFDMSVADGSTAVADKTALTVTWSGDVATFEATASNGQVRIEELTVTFK